MAISVDPMTFVITVPQADLTHISGIQYELNINDFRMWLKAWEDDQSYGITMLKTHNHNTEVTLSGLTYARIVEVLDPYTVEFEDGQYTVNCTGANHNLGDVRVANQVALVINNAAGLITSTDIEYAAYNGGVSVDVVDGVSITDGDAGKPNFPVDNLTDAKAIAEFRGFNTFYILGDITIPAGLTLSGYSFIGESPGKTTITVDTDAAVVGCEFYDATVAGTLDGNCAIKNCNIGNLNYVNGRIEQCLLEEGTIILGGSAEGHFLDCWSGVAGTSIPVIDMGDSGQDLSLRNYNGGIKLQNKSGSDNVTIDLNSGHVILDSTVTNGTIVIRGVGHVTDNSTGSANVLTNDLLERHELTDEHKRIQNLILARV